MQEPLDAELNHAVLYCAKRCWPMGWRASEQAPRTYSELCANVRYNSECSVVVWNGGSERTIFGSPEVNYAFRAWHDFYHYRYQQEFTPAGEAVCANLQIRQMQLHFGENAKTARWADIIRAEINGQLEYEQRYGEFPDNQRGFIEAYLVNKEAALSAKW